MILLKPLAPRWTTCVGSKLENYGSPHSSKLNNRWVPVFRHIVVLFLYTIRV
jgi:hypothetical protein